MTVTSITRGAVAIGGPGAGLSVRRVTAGDRERLVELLQAASPTSLYQRFLTGAVAPLPPRVVSHLLAVDGAGAAYFACLGDRVVAHGMWVPLPTGDPTSGAACTAEIALLVRDDHQRRGIGTALMRTLHAELFVAGYDTVLVTTVASNRAVVRMVARLHPGARPERGDGELTYALPVRATYGAAVGA